MDDTQLFHCPTCGAGLSAPETDATTVRCEYCGSSVVVPENLRKRRQPEGIQINIPNYPTYTVSSTPAVSYEVDGVFVDSATRSVTRSLIGGLLMTIVICGVVFAILATAGVFSIGSVFSSFSQIPGMESLATQGIPGFAQMTEVFSTIMPGVMGTPTPPLPYTIRSEFGEKGDAAGQLSDARWVAVDRSGNIYAADYQNGRITVFDSQGKYVRAIAVPADTNDLTYVSDIAIDPSTGQLAVLRTSDVLFYNTETGEVEKTYTVKFPAPRYSAIAFDVTGRMFVLYDSASRTGLGELDKKGNFIWKQDEVTKDLHKRTEISQVEDLVVDGSGNIFLLDNMLANVYLFNDKGKYQDRFGGEGDGPGQMNRPESIVLDSQGRLIIVQSEFINVFDRQGAFLQRIPRFWKGWLSDIALDANDRMVGISNLPRIYVVELSIK